MSNSYYEIIELANGEYALQRVDGDGEPLVRIKFSDEVKYYLEDRCIDVAKAMINTGIQSVGAIQREDSREKLTAEQMEAVADIAEADELMEELEGMAGVEEMEFDEDFDDEQVAPTLH